MSLPILSETGPRCTLCPLGGKAHVIHTCIPARQAGSWEVLIDSKPIRFLLLGEAPGYYENKAGVPFVGRSGRKLDDALNTIATKGLELGGVAISNAVRCQPAGNKNPPAIAKRTCKRYLDKELAELQPERIICLGGQAAAVLFDCTTFAVEKNRRKEFEYNGVPVSVTYHPSYILRCPEKTRAWLEDLHAYMVEGSSTKKLKLDIRLITTPAFFTQWYLKYKHRGPFNQEVALDLEWDSEGRILLAGLEFGPDSPIWAVPVYHPESTLDGEYVTDALRRLLNRPEITVVGHNLKSDLGILFKGDPVLCLADDSMMWHYQLDEHRASRTLETLAKEYTDYEKDTSVDATQIADIPLSVAAKYNAVDVALPTLIIRGIARDLRRYGYESSYVVEFNKRLIPFLACMESAGIAVDVGRVREIAKVQSERRDQVEADLGALAPQIENLNSHVQLSAYLYGTKGGFSEEQLADMGITAPLALDVPVVKNNWGTRYARTAEHVVDLLPDDEGFVTRLKEFRALNKELNTYVSNILKNLVYDQSPGGGMVYPDIFPATFGEGGGTVSGRLSIKNPPMQTIKKEMDIASAFISRYGSEGELLSVDGSQMELRWGAMESGDSYLQTAFKGQIDLHADTAKIAGMSRRVGKVINFASIYGCSLKKLVSIGINRAVAKRTKNILETNWATLYAFEKAIGYEILATGETRTPYGRVRRVPFTDDEPRTLWSHKVLQGINFRFQAPASDLTQLLGWLIMTTSGGVLTPIITNHDGLYFDLESKNRASALDIVAKACYNWPNLVKGVLGVELTIPYVFAVEIGPNLQRLEEVTKFECQGN